MVVIGHNQRIAWGVTNTGPDVQDLFLERVNPTNPDQVQLDGQWTDLQIREEIIQVAGGDPVVLRIRQSGHGPVLSDVDEELRRWPTGRPWKKVGRSSSACAGRPSNHPPSCRRPWPSTGR